MTRSTATSAARKIVFDTIDKNVARVTLFTAQKHAGMSWHITEDLGTRARSSWGSCLCCYGGVPYGGYRPGEWAIKEEIACEGFKRL